jgi:hypothetical protein
MTGGLFHPGGAFKVLNRVRTIAVSSAKPTLKWRIPNELYKEIKEGLPSFKLVYKPIQLQMSRAEIPVAVYNLDRC